MVWAEGGIAYYSTISYHNYFGAARQRGLCALPSCCPAKQFPTHVGLEGGSLEEGSFEEGSFKGVIKPRRR